MDVSGGGRGGLPLNSKNSLLHVSPLPPPNLSPVHSVWLNVPLISNHLAPLLGKHASLTLRFVCRACGASCTRAFATCETETKAFACPQSGSIRLLLWLADGFSTCPSLPWDRLAFECAESRRVDLVRLVLFGNSPRRQICALKSSSRVSLPSVLDVFLGLKFQRALQGAISSGDSATLWDVWCLHEDGKGGDTTQEGGPNTRAQAADGPRHALPNPSSSSPSTSPAGGIQMIQHIDRDTDASLGGMGGVPRVGALPSLLSRPGRLPRAELFRWLRHLGLRALRSLQPGVLRWLHRNCVLQYTREDVRRSLQVLDHATVSAVEEDELYAPLMKDFAHFLPVGASGGQRRAPPLSLRVAFAFLSGDAERVRQFLQSQSHENSEVAFRSKAKKLLRLAASGGFPSVVEVTLEWVRLRAQELGAQLGEEEGEEEGQGEGGPLAGGLVGAAAVILGQICADPSVIRAAASEGKGEVLGVLFDPLSGGGHPPFFAAEDSVVGAVSKGHWEVCRVLYSRAEEGGPWSSKPILAALALGGFSRDSNGSVCGGTGREGSVTGSSGRASEMEMERDLKGLRWLWKETDVPPFPPPVKDAVEAIAKGGGRVEVLKELEAMVLFIRQRVALRLHREEKEREEQAESETEEEGGGGPGVGAGNEEEEEDGVPPPPGVALGGVDPPHVVVGEGAWEGGGMMLRRKLKILCGKVGLGGCMGSIGVYMLLPGGRGGRW